MKIMNNTQKSIQVVLILNGEKLAGQLNATLTQSATAIDITNKINAEWDEYLGGIKSWSISCDGLYVKDSTAYDTLQQAFMNNQDIDVEVKLDNKKYAGKALFTEFPLIAAYNDTYKYKAKLLGNGELSVINE